MIIRKISGCDNDERNYMLRCLVTDTVSANFYSFLFLSSFNDTAHMTLVTQYQRRNSWELQMML